MEATIEETDTDIKNKIETNYGCTTNKSEPNCNEKNINNITYFMAHYLPKININLPHDKQINLKQSNIKFGKILGSGAFGFVFGFKDIDDFVMKICLCNTSEQKKLNNFEIYMNKIVSEFGNESYIKSYGLLNFDCINKNTQIKYENLIDNRVTHINIKDTCADISCEKYLIIEKGYKDLFDIMSDIIKKNRSQYDLNIILRNYLELFTSYTISKQIIIRLNKIFINNDIKIENIMTMNDKIDTKFKLIDFG